LHFGSSPKWQKDVIFIQVDIAAEELGNNASNSTIRVLGDVSLVVDQLRDSLSGWKYPLQGSAFLKAVREKASQNASNARWLAKSNKLPMGYHRALAEIKDALAGMDVVYVSEGANTMDISRSIFDVQEPRRRIDAGTFATMGVGMGYAIAGLKPSHSNLCLQHFSSDSES
jgi:2-hydroxyacyl-CoA lyase 1